VSEVVAGACVFQEFANDVAGGVDEYADRDVYVAADLFTDVAGDVGELLVEYGADDVGGLS
jgi:hypothetical protein